MKLFLTAFMVLFLSVSSAWAKKVPRAGKTAIAKKSATTLKSKIIARNIFLNEPVTVSSQFIYDYLGRSTLGESCGLFLIMKTVGLGGPNEVRTLAYLLRTDEEVRKGWSIYKVIDDKRRVYKIAVFPHKSWLEGEGRQNDLVTICE